MGLGKFHLVQEYNLTENFNGTLETIEYESNGNYISTLNDVIVIYLPIGNGVFKFGRLSFTNDGERKPTFNMFSSIDANMKKIYYMVLCRHETNRSIGIEFYFYYV